MKLWNVLAIIGILLFTQAGLADSPPVSTATQECLDCHGVFHPGIVGDWEKSRHGRTTPDEAMKIAGLSNKISATQIPNELKSHAVGCAECHTANPKTHKDTFEHNGYTVHVVVTPQDCATCHPTETKEYAGNLMANAYHNLASNEFYRALEKSITGTPDVQDSSLSIAAPTAHTKAETCYFCHGTPIEVTGMETRETDAGKLKFPLLSGWPNQGVGRINPDGSKGSCTACHTRHRFSMEMARKPHTCMGCHTGPDVPSYKVYSASKHGNIYASHEKEWDFNAVPWTVGKDFSAPSCATCHISLVVNTDGEPIAKRTHTMNDRLPWRIFGLIYAHPHPIDPDTSRIRNKDGLQLPTGFDGEIAAEYLIDKATQMKRQQTLQAICLSCHDSSWVSAHWSRFEHSIAQTNAVTKTATGIMQHIWKEGFATGPGKGGSPFDEAIENKWSDSWLFYANTVRFSAAMGGGGDYSVFANGYYQLSATLREMRDWYAFRKSWRESQAAQRAIPPALNRNASPAWNGSAR